MTKNKNESYLMNEDDPALQNFEQVARPPISTSAGQPPEVVDRYQGGVVSGLGLSPDIINSQLPGSSPAYRLMPAGIAGNPATNASIQSTSSRVVETAIAAIPAPTVDTTDIESIAINKQTGTSYTLQDSDRNTLVTFDNNAGGAITLPSPGGVATAGSTTGGQVDGSLSINGFSTTVNLSLSPSVASDFAITAFVGSATALNSTPTGWTNQAGTGGTINFFSKQQTGPLPITAVGTLATGQAWSACMVAFRSTGTTVVTDRGGLSGVVSNGQTVSLSSLTAGNFLVLVFAGDGIENGTLALGVADSQGNAWKQAGSTENAYSALILGNPGIRTQHVKIWSAPINSSGGDTVSLAIGAGTGTTVGGILRIYEVSGLLTTGPVSNLAPDWFSYIENTGSGTFGVGSLSLIDEKSQIVQLPPNTGMLVVYDGTNYYTMRGIDNPFTSFSSLIGLVSLAQGGTGADFSTTGGPHQVVVQTTAGGPLTIQQLDYNDLAGIQKAVRYNNLVLAGAGLVSIFQAQNQVALSANIALTNLAAIPGGGGMVRVSIYLIVSTPATVSSTLPDSQITYTDPDSNALITVNVTPGDTGNTTSTFQQATWVFMVKSGTIMQFAVGQVTPYTSVGATAMLFSYRCRVEFLG